MKFGCVYALLDESGCRYIGITTQDPQQRLYAHMHDAKRHESHKARWIAKLLREGTKPEIEILEDRVPEDLLHAREIEWIACLRAFGVRLTNATAGGEGVLSPSEETRLKMSKAHKGKRLSEEHRRNLSVAQFGRRHSEETKEKIRAASLRQVVSEETRQKISKANKGRKRSQEAREQSSAKLRGRKHSPETCAKKSASQARFKKPIKDQHGNHYESAQAAARQLGIRQPKIVSVLKGRRKSVHGYVFTYLNHSEQISN